MQDSLINTGLHRKLLALIVWQCYARCSHVSLGFLQHKGAEVLQDIVSSWEMFDAGGDSHVLLSLRVCSGLF